MTCRITFDSNNIDFDVMVNTLNIRHMQERNINRSGSGKIEVVNLYGIYEIEFTGVFDADTYYSLVAWWSWARQGQLFSFAADSSDVGDTTLDAAAAAAQKVIPLTATAAFASGDFCLIKAIDNDDEFEVIEIDSVSAGISVTAVSNLVYSYASADEFRHWKYWPELVCLNDEFVPDQLGPDTYQFTFQCAESL